MASLRHFQSGGAPPATATRQGAIIALGAVGISLSVGAAWAWSRHKRPAPELLTPAGSPSKQGSMPRKRRSGKRHKARANAQPTAAVEDSDSSADGGNSSELVAQQPASKEQSQQQADFDAAACSDDDGADGELPLVSVGLPHAADSSLHLSLIHI